jgi:hypothetical protein
MKRRQVPPHATAVTEGPALREIRFFCLYFRNGRRSLITFNILDKQGLAAWTELVSAALRSLTGYVCSVVLNPSSRAGLVALQATLL